MKFQEICQKKIFKSTPQSKMKNSISLDPNGKNLITSPTLQKVQKKSITWAIGSNR